MVADSRATKIMDLYWNLWEFMHELNSVDKRQSCAKTMASTYKPRHFIKFDDGLSSSQQSFLIQSIIRHEPSMYKTILTSKIGFHLEIEILYPILYIVASPPSRYDSLCRWVISNISGCLGYTIFNICDIDQPRIFGSGPTSPRLYTIFWAKCYSCI